MAKVKDLSTPFKKNEKVCATADLPGVPKGTPGKVKLWAGFNRPGSWARYWVFFDNGVQAGSVAHNHLVRPADWDRFFAEQERKAAQLAGAAAAAASSSAGEAASSDGGGDGGVASRVPAHLIERTKNRRKALGLPV
jgi:hypothetical protein